MTGDRRPLVDRLITSLFPFHLILHFADGCRIGRAGPALERWLGGGMGGAPFEEHFEIARPAGHALDPAALADSTDALFFLRHLETGFQLRGQFFGLAEDELAFLGSPLVTAVDSIDELDLAMSDFAAHDTTPDIMVLGRFAKMQISDLERQTAELREALEARDTFSERASTDPLTGLANRRAFWEVGQERLAAGGDRASLLVYLDVDSFKTINDEHGHQTGDQVLVEIAARFRRAVRPTDLVARLGGDEFAALLGDVEPADHRSTVDRVRAAVASDRIETDEGLIDVSLSVGAIAIHPGLRLDELVRDADMAMYEGRADAAGGVTWFEPRMRIERDDRRRLRQDLSVALAAHDIRPAFQPIVRIGDGALVAFEALARWTHPSRGPVGPDRFIAAAERAGLVATLDDEVLCRSLDSLSRWHRCLPGLGLQVNVSGRSIGPGLRDRVAAALATYGTDPATLTLEVTESWLIDGDNVVEVLGDIAALGVQLHLDDFGTGYSSLAHLHTYPISGLKIDRSFVAQLTSSDRSRRLVEATIGMARSMELDVVAEGVEQVAEARLLDALGCEMAQGYHYSRPLVAADADAFVAAVAVRGGKVRPARTGLNAS